MTFLVDTNVVSELRKIAIGRADKAVATWAGRTAKADLFLSVVTVLELELGILRIERRDVLQGKVTRRWLEAEILPSFAGRIIEIDEAIARRCARLHVPDPREERDALIAATALVHELTVVTRNVADFAPMGVPFLDPWVP